MSFCRHNTVDMCVAVATDAGLITPIVFGADRKVGLFQFVHLYCLCFYAALSQLFRPEHNSYAVVDIIIVCL